MTATLDTCADSAPDEALPSATRMIDGYRVTVILRAPRVGEQGYWVDEDADADQALVSVARDYEWNGEWGWRAINVVDEFDDSDGTRAVTVAAVPCAAVENGMPACTPDDHERGVACEVCAPSLREVLRLVGWNVAKSGVTGRKVIVDACGYPITDEDGMPRLMHASDVWAELRARALYPFPVGGAQ